MPLKRFLVIISAIFSAVTAVIVGMVFGVAAVAEGHRPWSVIGKAGFIVTLVTVLMVLVAERAAGYISKKYIKQLQVLKQTMKEAADGNLEVQCPIQVDNEIGDLVKNFNKMLLILKSSRDDLSFMKEMLEENEETMRSSYNQMEYLAYHDTLTELPNKLAFYERVEGVLKSSAETSAKHGILFIDLDNFKQINDTYGHEYGDSVLQQAAERLTNIIDREKDALARIGGDEFLIFAYDIGSGEKLNEWKEQIKKVFKEPFLLDGEEFHVTMSVGCALFPEHGTTHYSLVRNADTAMYHAKQSGKNQFCVFNETMGFTEEKKDE